MTQVALRGRMDGLPVVRVVIEEAPGLEHARGLVLATLDDAARLLEPFLAHTPPPDCLALALLDAQRRLLAVALLSGAWWGCCLRPSEVYRPALLAGAASLYLAHRHPAPELWALPADCQSFERVREMGKALGVEVHDHLIFDTRGRYASLHASQAVWFCHSHKSHTQRCPLPVSSAVTTGDAGAPLAPDTRRGRKPSQRPVVTLFGLHARVVRDGTRVPLDGERRVHTHIDLAPLLARAVEHVGGGMIAALVNSSKRLFAVAQLDGDRAGGDACEALTPETIYRTALGGGAHALYLAHDHAVAGPHIVSADRTLTARVYELGYELGLELRDHIIFDRSGHYVSLRDRYAGAGDWNLDDDLVAMPSGMRIHQMTSNRRPQHPGTRHAASARAALWHCTACGRMTNKKKVCRFCGAMRWD